MALCLLVKKCHHEDQSLMFEGTASDRVKSGLKYSSELIQNQRQFVV